MNREHELWWLNPAWVVGVMGTILAVAALLVPDWMYRAYWKTPKFYDATHMWMTLACVAAFSFGAAAGALKRLHGNRGADSRWMDRLPWNSIQTLFNACFWLTLVGYVAWAGAAVSRGANLTLALGVLRGDKGASYLMKEAYLGTISGVTTLTQLAMAAYVLAVLIGVAKGWRPVLPKCAVLFACTIVRALMNSERLAVMELLVPMVVVLVRLGIMDSPRFAGRLWSLLRAAPALGYAGLIGIFGASEYFRSWINYYAGGDLTFWQFVSLRLLGYYVTALNNGALLVQRIEPTGAPFFTLHLAWRLPVLSGIANALYPNFPLALREVDPYMSYLTAEANPEFNNGGGFLLPMLDFGFTGALFYWLLCGLVCGVLYRLFQQKRPLGLLLYPVVFVGAIELTRIIYWAEGRVLVPICVLAALALGCAYYARRYRIREENPAWPPSH
ncbi:MAG: hypothetical protein ABSH47_11660 [Bryobacteraceae bacterium]|jgi:hypothetical protein